MKITKISEYRYIIDYLGNDEVSYQITIDKWRKDEKWECGLQMYINTWSRLDYNFNIATKEAALEWALDKLQSLAIQIAFTQTRAEFKKELKRIKAE